ncbi:MAG: hypothetical protein D6776_01270 [Planctomycetota bacterium]|nr:MAG: hypothetical protein D6776_01270 [Planctomycetota bacterium]
MPPHVAEWLNLTVRWIHFTVGVAWIGASFYFNWLENRLDREAKVRDEIAGELWAVHGGGFYYLEKYKVAPKRIPERLHWFKWEAYFTWITGFLLLGIVYYHNARAIMIDPAVADISSGTAIGIGLGTLLLGWIVYDRLCRTRLVEHGVAFAITGYVLVAALAYGLTHVLSGRAAYMHVGAMLGTCMAANVFFVIIPGQRAMVEAARAGRPPDPAKGRAGAQRSRHNNYMTLPVLFVMISNHFPSTYGSPENWAVLAGLTAVGMGVRHYFNVRHMRRHAAWVLPVAALAMAALAYVTRPHPVARAGLPAVTRTVSFAEVQSIIGRRCLPCHSRQPTDDVFRQAQAGVMFDTPEQIAARAPRILVRAVQTRTMPFGNKTGMTDEERALIGAWIEQGAHIDR